MKTIEQIHKELVRDGLKSAKIEANGINIGIVKIFVVVGFMVLICGFAYTYGKVAGFERYQTGTENWQREAKNAHPFVTTSAVILKASYQCPDGHKVEIVPDVPHSSTIYNEEINEACMATITMKKGQEVHSDTEFKTHNTGNYDQSQD